MSRGLGAVQRKIAEILPASPDEAFTVPELSQLVYGLRVEKKHRVAIIRAAKALAQKRSDIGWVGSSGFGLVFFNSLSVMSYCQSKT